MKKTLLIAITALSINAFAQHPTSNILHSAQTPKHKTITLRSSTPPKFDSIHFYNWDTISNAWKFSSRATNYTFDANNNNTSETRQNWNTSTSAWVNSYKLSYTYDASNNQTGETDQTWDTTTSTWINSSKYTYTYDANNNQTGETDQTWDTTTSTWINSNKYSYTYDANNNLTGFINQTWDSSTSAWVNNFKNVYFYTGGTTDINNITTENGNIIIAPNPTTGIFNIQRYPNPKGGIIQINDVLGNSIYSSTLQGGGQTIDLSAEANGVYFISITTNEGIVNKKIVISK